MSYQGTKRWRKKHPLQLQAMKQRYYRQFEADAYNKMQVWTIADIDLITQKRTSDRHLAKQIGRSVKAIQIKRLCVRKEK